MPAATTATLRLLGSPFVDLLLGPYGVDRYLELIRPDLTVADYEAAQAWDPLGARYPAELGARVEARVGNDAAAAALLRRATRMEPSATNFRRLGGVLDAEGDHAGAAAAYRAGLRVDPNSLDLLLALAGDSPPGQALGVYRRVALLEDSPVGRVRAIGEVTEARFAIADAALASPAAGGDAAESVRYAAHAQRLLEAYLDEGGTLSPERQAQIGNHPDPAEDARFRDLYAQTMAMLVAAAPAAQRAALQSRAQDFLARFQSVIDLGSGDVAATPAAGAAAYGRAADELETYARTMPTDAVGAAQARDLYGRAMNGLVALAPPEQRAGLQAREQAGLQKFTDSFPTP